jgi:hypothetical protein
MDHFDVSPPDKYGNKGCLLFVDHFTHFPVAYPVKSYDAETTADVILQHLLTWGPYEQIACDPGSAFTSDLVQGLVNKGLAFNMKVSLVDRPQSNGCEGSVKQYLRHLKTIVHDKRMVEHWGKPSIMAIINYHLASFPTSETGRYTPRQLMLGSLDGKAYDDMVDTLEANAHSANASEAKAYKADTYPANALQAIVQPVGETMLGMRIRK